VSPQDPKNQQQILMILALAMSIVGALSVLHPVLNEIATLIRYFGINIGLVFLPFVSLMFDYLFQWFSSHSLETGVIALILVGVIPAVLEVMVSFWAYQDKLAVKVQPQNEIKIIVEKEIEEKRSIRCDF
ncbi:MAG: hypothetical protein H0T84_08485, partial [Tatlockia sp.]|nr:hypothetical protein [Tatlockia sp.]